MNVTNSRY